MKWPWEEEKDIHDMTNEEIFDLTEDDYIIKFWVWGRKIEDEIEYMEDNGFSKLEITEYLETCAGMREKFLEKFGITDIEDYYTDKIHPIFEEYGVIDPIF